MSSGFQVKGVALIGVITIKINDVFFLNFPNIVRCCIVFIMLSYNNESIENKILNILFKECINFYIK